MPHLEIVSLEEAQGQGRYVPDYIAYIQQLPDSKAGKLVLSESENPITVRKWLVLAGKAIGIPVGIRRRGKTIYFWVAPPQSNEQPTWAQPHLIAEAETGKSPEEPQPAESEGGCRSPGAFYRPLRRSASNNESRKDTGERGEGRRAASFLIR